MSYQVLARKWRPQNFSELVGQDRVLSGLINALNAQKLHHAYLFTGTRGVGKTTIARIMAKSLNCEQGISATPCGKCDACVEITEGRFIDLIEIDAASRTKVDDTRELLDNVPFSPTCGRFKVYLIDEIHMLSTHSFNALLKTLEEPPEHVKFLLATTDPQKLPITVLSRCLQFHLMNIEPTDIVKQLQHILTTEKITFDEPSLNLIAQSANGSLRDALSILDQAISYGNNAVNLDATSNMLGSIAGDEIYSLVDAITQNEPNALLASFAKLSQGPINYQELLATLAHFLHQISITQHLPEANITGFSAEKVRYFADNISPQTIQLLYQIAIIGKRDLPLAPEPKVGLEMVLLRMLAFVPESQINKINPRANENINNTPAKPSHHLDKKQTALQPKQPATTTTETPPTPPIKENTKQTTQAANTPLDWHETVKQVKLSGMAKQFIGHCSLSSVEEDTLNLIVSAPYSNMLNKKLEKKLRDALAAYLNKPINLIIHISTSNNETPAMIEQRIQTEQQQKLNKTIQEDEHIQYIKDKFNAKIENKTTALE